MQTEPIRVVLADDHMIVRKGIAMILENVTDIEIVGEAGSGEETISCALSLRPDVILMDIKMNGMDGVEATRAILGQLPSTRIVGLSTFASRDIVSEMLEVGARGYLAKDVSSAQLLDVIRRVHAGEIVHAEESPARGDQFDSAPMTGASKKTRDGLGAQQIRVLALMTKGFTNPEIAEQLGISHPTARYHVSAILRKLDVSNRSEAVAIAFQNGLVKSEDF